MRKLICLLFGHNYYVYAKPKEGWGKGIRWLKCKRCRGGFAMNDNVRVLVPMDLHLTKRMPTRLHLKLLISQSGWWSKMKRLQIYEEI